MIIQNVLNTDNVNKYKLGQKNWAIKETYIVTEMKLCLHFFFELMLTVDTD